MEKVKIKIASKGDIKFLGIILSIVFLYAVSAKVLEYYSQHSLTRTFSLYKSWTWGLLNPGKDISISNISGLSERPKQAVSVASLQLPDELKPLSRFVLYPYDTFIVAYTRKQSGNYLYGTWIDIKSKAMLNDSNMALAKKYDFPEKPILAKWSKDRPIRILFRINGVGLRHYDNNHPEYLEKLTRDVTSDITKVTGIKFEFLNGWFGSYNHLGLYSLADIILEFQWVDYSYTVDSFVDFKRDVDIAPGSSFYLGRLSRGYYMLGKNNEIKNAYCNTLRHATDKKSEDGYDDAYQGYVRNCLANALGLTKLNRSQYTGSPEKHRKQINEYLALLYK